MSNSVTYLSRPFALRHGTRREAAQVKVKAAFTSKSCGDISMPGASLTIYSSLSPSSSSHLIFGGSTANMEPAHEPVAAVLVERQQRASSFPLPTPIKRASEKMGRSYRTPSPLRESRFDLEYDVTPKANEHKRPTLDFKTPPGSPTIQAVLPQTPTYKERALGFFGLLTPSTPGFGDVWKRSSGTVEDRKDIDERDRTLSPCDSAFAKSPALVELSDPTEGKDLDSTIHLRKRHRKISDTSSLEELSDDEPLLTQYERMQQEIKDAKLAAGLAGETEVTSSRRSTRLARKETVKPLHKLALNVVPQKPTEPEKESTPPRDVAPPDSSFTAEAVVPLPPDSSPAHLTLDWNLQYPPGGSTHPSYSYPVMDPMLFFDPKLVPVIDGLPSVFKVPALMLPMGWKHVTWTGFLPIVFDPYQQAFKLTPIGPLPLTCEEVQQGGLAKYVPGGEEHPEAGLLPNISFLSDGSDEVYNFEEVDWTLPWPKEEVFERRPVSTHTSAPSASASSAQFIIAPASPSFYDETRDCPDSVVDINDAWRWLEEKELHPTASFVPTPGRSWKGTGIHRTATKTKSPIASLMGLVIADTIESPNNFLATHLNNQNGRAFCPFRSVATPVYANITLLKDVEITLVEFLSYFPNHYVWRKGGDRIVRAGFRGSNVADFINWSRALEGDAAKNYPGLNDSLAYVYDAVTKQRTRIERDPNEAATYTAEGWEYTVWDLIGYPLLGLTHGLKHLPEGPDAGPLTQLIKFCRENGRYRVLLSDVPEMLREQAIEPLIEPGVSGDPDKEVLGRFENILKIDRKRVLKDKQDRKAAAEKDGVPKKKRVKTE